MHRSQNAFPQWWEIIAENLESATFLWSCKKGDMFIKDWQIILYSSQDKSITKILFPTEQAHRAGIEYPIIPQKNIHFYPHNESGNIYVVIIQEKVFCFDEKKLSFYQVFSGLEWVSREDISVVYSWECIGVEYGKSFALKLPETNNFRYSDTSLLQWKSLEEIVRAFDKGKSNTSWALVEEDKKIDIEAISHKDFFLENGNLYLKFRQSSIQLLQFLPDLELSVKIFYAGWRVYPIINGKIFYLDAEKKELIDIFPKTNFLVDQHWLKILQESVWSYEVITSWKDVCIVGEDGFFQSFSCTGDENVREVIENIKLWIPSDVVVQDLVWDDEMHQGINDEIRHILDTHTSNTTGLALKNITIKSDGLTTTIVGMRWTVEYSYRIQKTSSNKIEIHSVLMQIYIDTEVIPVVEHGKISWIEFVTLEDNSQYISTQRLGKDGTYLNFLSKIEDVWFRPKQHKDFARFWSFFRTDTLMFQSYQGQGEVRIRSVTFSTEENLVFAELQSLFLKEKKYLEELKKEHYTRIDDASTWKRYLDRELHFRKFRELEKFEKYVRELETRYEMERRKMLQFQEGILENYDIDVYHINDQRYPMGEPWEMFFICRSKKNTWVFGWKTEVKIFHYDVKKWVALEVATKKVKKWENIQIQRSDKQRFVTSLTLPLIISNWILPQHYDYFDIQTGFKTLADAFKIKKQSRPQERKIQEFIPASTSWYDVWFDGKKAYLSWEVPKKFENEFWIDMFEWKGALYISMHWVLEPMKKLRIGADEFFMFPPKNLWVKIDRKNSQVGWPTRYQDRLFYGYGFALDGTKVELWGNEKAIITYTNGDIRNAVFVKAA
jgi:hypothetical protein